MTNKQKSINRWALTKAILIYVALYGVGLLLLAAFHNTAAVTSLGTFVLGIIGLASTIIAANFATPVGGFKQKDTHDI